MFKYFMKKKYPDWEDNEYNNGALKFIWGVKSADCLSSDSANFYTMNDIQIIYDRKSKIYTLSVESIYQFDSHQDEAEYFSKLLDYFTDFMKENNYDMDDPYYIFAWAPAIVTASSKISELYTMFRIFVEGYKAVYGGDSDA